MIRMAKPMIDWEEIEKVVEVLESGMIAGGDVVKEFEGAFAEYIGVKHSVAVFNGTIALDLALKACKIHGEVITTPFTFIATANSILYQGAKPVFVDIEERTFNIDPDRIVEAITSKTEAVLGVHIFGHPFDLDAIMEICEDHGLILIEDSAQAHGAEYDGRKVGSFGIGCFSFYATKNMTTGEGGIITTNDDDISKCCELLRNHGDAGKYEHIDLGYNFRMTNMQGAMGLVQLKKLDRMNDLRRRNADYLNRHIKVEGLIKPYEAKNVRHVYHQYVVRLTEDFPMNRREFMEYLMANGIGCAIHYPMPIYMQPLYVKLGFECSCPIAEDISSQVLSLPIHPALSKDELRKIADVVNSVA